MTDTDLNIFVEFRDFNKLRLQIFSLIFIYLKEVLLYKVREI